MRGVIFVQFITFIKKLNMPVCVDINYFNKNILIGYLLTAL